MTQVDGDDPGRVDHRVALPQLREDVREAGQVQVITEPRAVTVVLLHQHHVERPTGECLQGLARQRRAGVTRVEQPSAVRCGHVVEHCRPDDRVPVVGGHRPDLEATECQHVARERRVEPKRSRST